MTTKDKRPLAITLLSILLVVNSMTSLLFALYRILSGTNLVLESALLLPKYFLNILDIFSIFYSIWVFVLVVGLWKMRKWSWIGTLITQAISGLIVILAGVFGWIRGDFQSNIFTLIASMIFTLWIICYFLRPKIKAAFHMN